MTKISEPTVLALLHFRWPRSILIGQQTLNFGAGETKYSKVLRTNLRNPWHFPNFLSFRLLTIEYRDESTLRYIYFIGSEQQLLDAKRAIDSVVESVIQNSISNQKKWIEAVERERSEIYQVSHYVRHSKAKGLALKWIDGFEECSRHNQYFHTHPMTSEEQRHSMEDIKTRLKQIRLFLTENDFNIVRERHNNEYINTYRLLEADFFKAVESSPLNEDQIKSVLVFDDVTLVIAPAGSGKSSCIVAKIGFAIKSGLFKDHEILALSYNTKAAESLQLRLSEKIGRAIGRTVNVSAKTFHGFGLSVLREKHGKNLPKVLKEEGNEENRLIKLTINSLLENDPEFQSAISTWMMLSAYESPEPAGSGENDLDECERRYERCCRDLIRAKREGRKFFEPMIPTLNESVYVRSLEERNIVNWLLLHDVEFEYEKPDWDGAKFLGLGKYESGKQKPYKPDFTYSGNRTNPQTGDIQKITVIHEHFALDENGRAPAWINSAEYERHAQSKREMFNTRWPFVSFFETQSYQAKSGTIFSILERSLRENGVEIGSQNPNIREKALSAFRESSEHEALLIDFVIRFKDSGLTKEEVDNKAELSVNSFRAKLFLQAAFRLSDAYQKRLEKESKIDFSDMIKNAIELLQSGEIKVPYRLILVDEFQDISRSRANLVKAALEQDSDESIAFCVGDDWQTINRFSGSDVSIFSESGQYFDRYSEQVFLRRTYRCSQPIADVSKGLVMGNSGQIDKDVIGPSPKVEYGIRVVEHGDNSIERTDTLIQELKRIVTQSKKIGLSKPLVYVLRRTRKDTTCPEGVDDDFLKSIARQFRGALEIESHTLHGSKGLEADYVIIPGLESGFRGFPDERPAEPLIDLVLPKLTDLVEEERRLFYVGLTRARHQAIVLASAVRPSQFLLELSEKFKDTGKVDWVCHDTQRVPCPKCNVGSLVKFVEGSSASFCTRRQFCGYIDRAVLNA